MLALSSQRVAAKLGLSGLSNGFRGLMTTMHINYPDVAVPPMGDSISEGTISAVLKKSGDTVNVDNVIMQVETDKVTAHL